MKKRLDKSQIAEIIQHYQNGVSPKEIGQMYDILNNSVTRILRKAGVDRDRLVKFTEEETKFIIEEYSKGVSSEIIAAKLSRDGTAVRRVLRRNNIKIRPTTRNLGCFKTNKPENSANEEKS